MAQFIVVREYHGVNRGGLFRLPPGKVLDDTQYDIPTLQTAGVRMVPSTAGLQARIASGDRRVGDALAAVTGDGLFSTNLLRVDGNTKIGPNDQDGTGLRPYNEINKALEALPDRSQSIEMRRAVDRIHVANTPWYNEALRIDISARNLEIVGKFNLGVFDKLPQGAPGSGWEPDPANRRDVTVVGDVKDKFGLASSLVITSDTHGMAEMDDTTFSAVHGPRISGKIDIQTNEPPSPSGWGIFVSGDVYGTEGDGTGTSIDHSSGGSASALNLQVFQSRIRGKMSLASNGRLADLIGSRFDGDIESGFWGRMQSCMFFGADLTALNSTSGTGDPPNGFIHCNFPNAFNWNGSGDFFVDAFSNARAKAAPVTITGSAVKVITGDLTP